MRAVSRPVLLFLSLCAPGGATLHAQAPAARLEAIAERWRDQRETLSRSGLDLALSHTLDASAMRVHRVSDAAAVRGVLDLSASLDLEKALGLPGATLFVQHLAHGGEEGSAFLGDAQGFSNIDAEPFTGVGELWYEQRLAGDALRLRVGRLDANAEFAVAENAGGFLNSAMGVSPTLFAMPTYPAPAAGLALFARPLPWLSLGGGAYDGRAATADPDRRSAFLLSEAAASWSGGRLGVGGWRHTGAFEGRDGAVQGSSGWYLVLDQRLWGDPSGEGEGPSAAGFVQYGSADAAAAELPAHLGAGVRATGLLPGRPGDELGLGASWVRIGDPAARESELVAEGYCALQAASWLRLQADVQYMHDPLADPVRHRLFAATLRLIVEL